MLSQNKRHKDIFKRITNYRTKSTQKSVKLIKQISLVDLEEDNNVCVKDS